MLKTLILTLYILANLDLVANDIEDYPIHHELYQDNLSLVECQHYSFEKQPRSYVITDIRDEVIMGNLTRNVIYITRPGVHRFIAYNTVNAHLVDGWEVGDVLVSCGNIETIIDFVNARTHEEVKFINVYWMGFNN